MHKKILQLTILFFFISNTYGQVVTGLITDSSGEPLQFVTIQEKGTTNGVLSNQLGAYSIQLKNPREAILQFSYIGFKTQNVPVNGMPSIDISLVEDIKAIDELVVVGYGVQKKSNVTGSISVINVESAKELPTTNIAEMLRGKSPGVQITLTDPRPGGKSNILIRGKNSFIGGNDPLIVLDGVPIDNINNINPEDVKSIEILKDASAQAIYGARASNGVILVTTKRGSKGKLIVSYHTYFGENWLTRNFNLYSGEEWAQLRREAFRTANNGEWELDEVVFDDPLQLEVLESGEYVDWEEEVMQNTTQQSHSITLQGGGEKSSIYASFGYFDQGGLIPGSAYKRGTARLNYDYKISDRIKFGSNIYLLTDRQDRETGGLNFITLPPLAKVYEDDGSLRRYPTGSLSTTSPLWNLRESNEDIKANQYQFTFFMDVKIFENFTYKLNTSVTHRNSLGGRYRSRLHASAFDTDGEARLTADGKEEFLVENILTYDKEINSNNRIDFTAMQSVNGRKYNWTRTTATGFPNDMLGYNGIASATDILPVDRSAWDRGLLSYMGRVRYYLSNKYIFTLTGRADGSTVFAPGNKWGFFPSAAFAWKAHLEPFMKKLGFVNEFKVRLSYGSIGNEAIKPYQTLGLASEENYIFGGTSFGGYDSGSSLFNPNLKWETSTTLNVGIDFGLFKNMLVGNLELYNTQTTDLLVDRKTPGGTGYTSIISNIGRVQNQGIELGFTTDILRRRNLDWSVTTTFSRNRNKIIELFGEVDKDGNLIDDISKNRFIGEPINVIYTYQFDGIWQTEEEIVDSHMPDASPGNIRVKDNNGDLTIDPDDKIIISKDPKWYGSISSRVMFHGFELFGELYIVQGAVKTNNYLADYNSGGTLHGNLNGIKVDYWTPENPSNRYPRPNHDRADPYLWAGAVCDASYIRIRTISLSYHLPTRWVNKLKLSNFTVYSTFTNPFTWTKFKSYSPETLVGAYPDGKGFVFGIKISTDKL